MHTYIHACGALFLFDHMYIILDRQNMTMSWTRSIYLDELGLLCSYQVCLSCLPFKFIHVSLFSVIILGKLFSVLYPIDCLSVLWFLILHVQGE